MCKSARIVRGDDVARRVLEDARAETDRATDPVDERIFGFVVTNTKGQAEDRLAEILKGGE